MVMDKQEILEGNKIIAEFLGWEKINYTFKYKEWDETSNDFGGEFYIHCQNMNFDKSWTWIMPVVIKIIANHRTDFYIDRMNYDNFFVGLGTDGTYSQNERNDSAIEGVFKSVVGFIKWYNSQKTSADVVITKK